MKIDGNEIRPGNVIIHKGRLWVATKTSHVKPGKGPAYNQVELKDIMEGTKLNERFRASETVERARLDEYEHQYLYTDGDQYTFMNTENYEQVSIGKEMLEDQIPYLQENMNVYVTFHEGKPLSVVLPQTVVLAVTDTEPVVKGQTAAGSNKPAKLENGIRVMVPTHINIGDRLVINVEEGAYVERAKD